ncbi:MAG: hypothetical protein COV07_01630 [Candidatus Vogelbacteria bacterium CG10_big_fil_rev_8_21_14_0_10_45_14]|uniref:Uncharacterized protein n=1 Tax=Candidatus Vogelbacteria bacterium CG10_big_fil_rev_8_21_14_0_10_45_14 TaxID=1975042 RepID=A0A2H0RMD5_9BACT|nr:MAG: hypothetical protein COV07_01630 [Candidatus Vogelbacteria bacterium CG10_big_fil_rev_8_21_14_0_10_45_14]
MFNLYSKFIVLRIDCGAIMPGTNILSYINLRLSELLTGEGSAVSEMEDAREALLAPTGSVQRLRTAKLSPHILMCVDNVNEIEEAHRAELYSLIGSWREQSRMTTPLQMSVLLSGSNLETDSAIWGVGPVIKLGSFDKAQTEELAKFYQLDSFVALEVFEQTKGKPAAVQQALYGRASRNMR